MGDGPKDTQVPDCIKTDVFRCISNTSLLRARKLKHLNATHHHSNLELCNGQNRSLAQFMAMTFKKYLGVE